MIKIKCKVREKQMIINLVIYHNKMINLNSKISKCIKSHSPKTEKTLGAVKLAGGRGSRITYDKM